jgi:hypothetical protein
MVKEMFVKEVLTAQANALLIVVEFSMGPHSRTSAPVDGNWAIQHPPPVDGTCEPESPADGLQLAEVHLNVNGSASPGYELPNRSADAFVLVAAAFS